jgi:hypothetical protein
MHIISSTKVPTFDKDELEEFSRKMSKHFRNKNRKEKLNKINMKKKFALIPLRTEEGELVWLKYLNVTDKLIEREYEFKLFGEVISISYSYNKNIYSKIK